MINITKEDIIEDKYYKIRLYNDYLTIWTKPELNQTCNVLLYLKDNLINQNGC